MTKEDNQMLIDLVTARGVPGNEEEVREVFTQYAQPHADQILQDGLGSIIAEKQGPKDAPKIMFAGHLDEVGFMVTRITEEGFIKFQTLVVGGIKSCWVNKLKLKPAMMKFTWSDWF